MIEQDIFQWPGKSAAFEGGICHPAVYHMLDVAAVAEVLIAPFQYDAGLRHALVFLVALHDLGKVSDSFREMLQGGRPQRFRHWELSEALFFVFDADIARHIGGDWRQRQMLYAAVAGHHGQPSGRNLGGQPGMPKHRGDLRDAIAAVGSGLEAARQVIERLAALWPRGSLSALDPEAATTSLSWWLPGFCAVADWVGSNTDWFPAQSGGGDLAAYLGDARRRAGAAVDVAGLAGSPLCEGAAFDFALRPMQSACRDVKLPEGPTLAIIEEETGAGKTEAALLLAQRMLQAGKGRGVFFALPTMATADAMFRRACDSVGRIFMVPSLTLAHGRAGLSVPFRDLPLSSGLGQTGAGCSSWLYESRRRALLADVGVGTVDQALLSVLPVRYQTLRHFGLSSKILIVDEVHEMGEPYIGRELERLLQMHRAAGGSAILLTATLPLALRAKLLAAWQCESSAAAYPALTVSDGTATTDFAVDPRPRKGPVQVERLATAENAVSLIAESAARGAACVWVRNSVDDAIEAVDALRAQGIKASLLHARFALCDRKRLEAEVTERVGKEGQERAGFVLVGTQVLEASLDLDFDVMVSDLAPVAALIQRAGRLWRHMEQRPAASRPVAAPVLYVLSPDPADVASDRWLQGTLGSGAWVYNLADMWRSARVIFSTGRIAAPEGLRALIEAVHGDQAEDLPAAFQRADLEADGRSAAARTLALHNLVDLSAGYRNAGRGEDDAKYPTRLGDETRTLVLVRRSGQGLRPWADCEGISEAEAWALSEVSVPARRLRGLSLPDPASHEIIKLTRDWPEWRRNSCIVCPVECDGPICEGLSYDANCGILYTSSR